MVTDILIILLLAVLILKDEIKLKPKEDKKEENVKKRILKKLRNFF